MKYQLIIVSFALSALLYADQKPINSTITEVYGHYGSGWVQTKQIDKNTISVYTPNSGAVTHVRRDMERICLAMGGNVYLPIVDSFGDTVTIAGFDAQAIESLTPQQRLRYIEFSSENKSNYIISRDDIEKLYTKAREKKAFLGSDDYFMITPRYDTVCKEVTTNQPIYTTKSVNPNTFEVKFDETKASPMAQKNTSVTIDEYMSEYVKEKKEGKLLLNLLSGSKYPQMVQSYCDTAGGTLHVNGTQYRSPVKLSTGYESVACLDIAEPFMLEPFGGKGYLITKNKLTSITKGQAMLEANDPFAGIAVSAATMPLSSQSETNLGNIKAVATVYEDTGSYKLVNVQEIGGNRTYKNYRVISGKAVDITDNKFVNANLKLPQSILNAKGSLVQQCSQYGAGKVSIDGYTATCSRQSYGNQCSVNLIYMRNDQFSGREAVGCK